MLKLLLLLVFAEILCCIGYDRTRFKTDPVLIKKDCDVKKLVGTWYINYHLPPCSWKGSEGFTNFVKQIGPDGTAKLHWRTAKGCVKNIPIDVNHEGAGKFTVSDRIGNVITGQKILVCSDYDKYAIYYGCTRRCGKGIVCLDPYLVVETRVREVDVKGPVYAEITKKLSELWDMKCSELIKVNQDKANCCVPKAETKAIPIAEPKTPEPLP